MKKLNNYKIAFLFSLVPCVVFLFVVTVVAISGYGYNMGRHAYGMVAVGNWLGNIGDYWFDFNIRHIIIFTCLIYQTTYILALRSLPYKENHQTGIGVKSNRKTGKAAKIFLWLSFVPYAFVILMSICSAIFGTREWAALFGEGRLIYGFEALQQDIFLLTAALTIVFPVIPICLVYQIVYLTVKIVKKRKTKASTESDDTEPIFDDSHENRETSVQNDFPIIKKVTLIVTFVAWGFFCLILSGFFAFSDSDPYIDPAKKLKTADFSFSYTSDYSEQKLIPAGATRYIHLDEMRIYWYKDNNFGYNELSETDEMFMGWNNDYYILLTWEGEGRIKTIYAVGTYDSDGKFYHAPGDPLGNILDIYIEMHDGRLLQRNGNFRHI